jgi:curved DNA-binding protein CbpA
MDIELCYRILQVMESSSDEDISRSFKSLAKKYHPDKNPQKSEWANEQMAVLNNAYSAVMSHRFSLGSAEAVSEYKNSEEHHRAKPAPAGEYRKAQAQRDFLREEEREYLIARFVKAREDAKDALYKYFQYNLDNFHRREERGNTRIYNDVVKSLRKSYHLIKKYSSLTNDRELLEHFTVFNKMIFDFYRAAECLNLIDSYKDNYEVDAFRMYRQGDEFLHKAQKELFFNRHNRGFFERKKTIPDLLDAENIFRATIQVYKNSSWAVETSIKLEYLVSLKAYISLFFSGE